MKAIQTERFIWTLDYLGPDYFRLFIIYQTVFVNLHNYSTTDV